MCWCGPWNPFLKERQQLLNETGSCYFISVHSQSEGDCGKRCKQRYIDNLNQESSWHASLLKPIFAKTSAQGLIALIILSLKPPFYLLCKGQSQRSLHSPLYPAAGYPASNLCKVQKRVLIFGNWCFWGVLHCHRPYLYTILWSCKNCNPNTTQAA